MNQLPSFAPAGAKCKVQIFLPHGRDMAEDESFGRAAATIKELNKEPDLVCVAGVIIESDDDMVTVLIDEGQETEPGTYEFARDWAAKWVSFESPPPAPRLRAAKPARSLVPYPDPPGARPRTR